MRGEQVADVGVLHVLGIRHRTDEVEGEACSHVEADAQFNAVEVLLDTRHADVGEGVDIIVVVVLPFVHARAVVEVGGQVGSHPTGGDGITEFGAEHVLHLQSVDEVVVHLSSLESRAAEGTVGRRRIRHITYAEADDITLAEVDV